MDKINKQDYHGRLDFFKKNQNQYRAEGWGVEVVTPGNLIGGSSQGGQ